MAPKIWFITGSSSGMGRAMTEHVLSQGDIAVATLRKPAVLADLARKYTKDRLLVVKLDVTKKAEIQSAFAAARAAFGRVDVVFNNAGYSVLGELESVPEETARTLFDTNFWGSLNVALEAVRVFRDENQPRGGRLINNSSLLAVITGPAIGIYAASKHALEGVMETLAIELDPTWNIKVTNILPGAFATRGLSSESMVLTDPHPAYAFEGSSTAAARKLITPGLRLPGDTEKAMKVVYEQVATMNEPPLRLLLGKDALIRFETTSKMFAEDATKYASLSDDLLHEGASLPANWT
ncbi:NAD(P)-binding protein [Fomitopsis betulina]|nr:NAD(P)-binding protein [Fomitopsis betulina]